MQGCAFGGFHAHDLHRALGIDPRPVCSERNLELGAAYLAGLYTDVWKSREEIAAQWQMDRRFEPTMSRDEAQSLLARWRDAVKRSTGWAT